MGACRIRKRFGFELCYLLEVLYSIESKALRNTMPGFERCYIISRFPSSPLIIRVPFFLLFGFNKGTPQKKG